MNLATIYRDECVEAGVMPEYERLLAKGNTPQFAAMLALKQPPGTTGSDRALMEGQVLDHGLSGYPDWFKDMAMAEAKKAGISTAGKVYKSGLADQRGPACPEAWVGGVDDVVAACKKRNLNCRGAVNYTGYQPDPTPDIPLAEDLIQESIPEMLMEQPRLAKKPDQLREAIIEKHGAPAAKKRKSATKFGGGPIG